MVIEIATIVPRAAGIGVGGGAHQAHRLDEILVNAVTGRGSRSGMK